MLIGLLILTCVPMGYSSEVSPSLNDAEWPWTWNCINDTCIKQPTKDHPDIHHMRPSSFEVCRLTCGPGVLWPKPTGRLSISTKLLSINPNTLFVKSIFADDSNSSSAAKGLVKAAGKRFLDIITRKIKGTLRGTGINPTVTLGINDSSVTYFQQHADESYQLYVTHTSGEVIVDITANTFLGARHGLETLSQLIVFDVIRGELVMPDEVEIIDKAKYTHRGILLDTARNFVSINTIKNVIEGMAMNKLNTFHWHITDSHSFPFQSKSYPMLTEQGAYGPGKVYTEDDIQDLVDFAQVRGVRILPEFDAPAHVGEGWQWAGDAAVCINKQPWRSYCVEPPCGQLNPTSEEMYKILEGIYTDMERLFKSDLFHMGGDEVNINCWNSTNVVVDNMLNMGLSRTDEAFHELWAHFQSRAAKIHEKVTGKAKKIVLWTSTLTEKGKVDKYLDPDRYIIQIWTTGSDPVIAELIKNKFPVIFSNYDALYFDCGFGAWIGSGNNWCSPYIPWQKVYENDPNSLLTALGVNATEHQHLVLGSEATLWTEQADDQSIDNRLWPRAAAMAEQLYSGGGQWQDAEHRFLLHRQRMVENGIHPDTIQPEWCLQNPGNCY